MKGLIFDLQHFSVQDGPGIRTTVFLKGCSLRCVWCHNPESQDGQPQVSFTVDACLRCGTCETVCPHNACSLQNPWLVDRTRCHACGLCGLHCPAGALTVIGREVTVDAVVTETLKDEAFYHQSGGGVTISGGEPFNQIEFVSGLCRSLKALGFHLTLDTSGYGRGDEADRRILLGLISHLDLILYDLKLIDDRKHQQYTGVSNRTILDNASMLGVKYPHKVIFRYPLIPGINDSPQDIEALKTFLSRLPGNTLDILPYHRLGIAKYRLIGKEPVLHAFCTPSDEEVNRVRQELALVPGLTVRKGIR